MNQIKRVLAVALASTFALAAFAAKPGSRDDGSRSIHVTESVILLGAAIPPGTYALRWTREYGSEEVNLEIARGHKVLARGKGVWIESESPSPYHALVYRPSPYGKDELTELRFARSADAIQVVPSAQDRQAASAKSQ